MNGPCKNIYGQLVCGICSDLLNEPKTLVCTHSFCKDCLIKQHDDSNRNNCDEIEENGEREGPNNKIECPDCLQITILHDEQSINGLRTHSQLEETIASLTPDEKQNIREKLGNRKKVIADIAGGNRDFCPEMCKLHGLQHQYFCSDCNITACIECINSIHAAHQYSEISTLLVDSLSQLQRLMQPACESASRADASLGKLTQDSESIESNRNMCKEAVFEVFNKVRELVNDRETILLDKVDKYVDRKLSQVAHQKKNLSEVQDQLYQSIQEIQQMLDSSLTDVMLVMDKQRLIDDIDVQEQNILDIENAASNSMFSSTYIGFRDDDTQSVQKQIDLLITLCELYPDADTGYYSSRVIPDEKEESLYTDLEPHENDSAVTPDSGCSSTYTQIEEEDEPMEIPKIISKSVHTAKIPSLTRSQSSPSMRTKEMWLAKRRKNTTVSMEEFEDVKVPLVPIRFDSLLLPTPVVIPEKIFSKLTVSKLETVYPCGICIGENNSFIISDVKNHCLRIIASNGKCIGAIGKEGKGSGQFEDPCAVVSNEKAQIFACQRENPRIQKLTSGGKYIQKFGHKSLRGSSLGEPWGIAIGPNNKLYVTDWDKSCIHIFYSNGRYDCTIGSDDTILGESLKFPAGIAVNASCNLIVADRGNHCVWVLETDGSILMRIGTKGHGPGELFLPHGVAVHPNGSIIVTESGNNRVSIFSSCGKFMKHFGRKGAEPGMFNYPRHVCVTPKGDIVVADEQNQRLQLFKF